jgi:hypothetical protein
MTTQARQVIIIIIITKSESSFVLVIMEAGKTVSVSRGK